MKVSFSLLASPVQYKVILSDARAIYYRAHTAFNALNAKDVYEQYLTDQRQMVQETFVALIADDVLVKATHVEVQCLDCGQLNHNYRIYNQLTDELRFKTQTIWNRTELSGTR